MTIPLVDDLIQKARMVLAAGQIELARELFEQILAPFPFEPQAVFFLGICHAHAGQYSLAEEYLRQAQVLDPNLDGIETELAKIAAARNKVSALPYVKQFVLSRARYQHFPRYIGIETTGRCNATCEFCPHSDLERNSQVMSDDLFHKIIRDLQEIPPAHPLLIFPNHVNEPFMDRKIFDRMTAINNALPNAQLHIFTNFNVLPKGFFDKIVNVKAISAFNVSFNAGNKAGYEETMGIDFERTVANIRALLLFNRTHRLFDGPIILSRVADHTPRDLVYLDEVRAIFDDFIWGEDFIATVKNRTTWLYRTPEEMPKSNFAAVPSNMPCGAWFDVNVFVDGTVPHCCIDVHGDYAIGNVNKASLLEIYNGQKFSFYRRNLLSRNQAFPCNTCSLLQ